MKMKSSKMVISFFLYLNI